MLARARPKQSDFPTSDIFGMCGYTWSHSQKLGEGSYGKVYLGWSKDNMGAADIAVKYVLKERINDPKAVENMMREISILRDLKDCPYVVRLWHDVKSSGDLILFTELCDFDLEYYVKKSSFGQKETKLFLLQMAEGIKVLQNRNIVHRDLKPQNILVKIDPVTQKMQFKIADFGFARYYKDEGNKKTIDLHSLAGTPVFMAPEALHCVMTDGKTPYNAKVDLWSIGALLYKCLVGQCGFYAVLQKILPILEKKGDAIAFERNSYPVRYIHELPTDVQDRISREFAAQVTKLLVQLLKVNPNDRMSFQGFFEAVSMLTKNNIELVDGMSGEVERVNISGCSNLQDLYQKISALKKIPQEKLILFSESCQFCVTPWTKDSYDLSDLVGSEENEEDEVLYCISTEDDFSKMQPSIKCVDDAGSHLSKLPNVTSGKKIGDIVARLLSSSGNGLAALQKRQLKGIRNIWALSLKHYREHAARLRRVEGSVVESAGSISAGIQSQRQNIALLGIMEDTKKHALSAEEDLENLERAFSELTKGLGNYSDTLEVLSSKSLKDVTCQHSYYEAELRRLRSDAVTTPSVELQKIVDAATCVHSQLRSHVEKTFQHILEDYRHVVELLRIVSSSLLQANPLEEQATDLMLKVQQNQENTFTLIQRHMSNMCVEGGTVVIELSNSEENKDVAEDCAECAKKTEKITQLESQVMRLANQPSLQKDDVQESGPEETLKVSTEESTMNGPPSEESTLCEIAEQLRKLLAEREGQEESVVDVAQPKTMESFVVVPSEASPSKTVATMTVEIKEMITHLSRLELSTTSASASRVPTEEKPLNNCLVKLTSNYQRGDLALFVPTKDPNIYCAVTNEPKKRIFLDRNSFKKYEDKFKSTTIPTYGMLIGRVVEPPAETQPLNSTGRVGGQLQSFLQLKCVPKDEAF